MTNQGVHKDLDNREAHGRSEPLTTASQAINDASKAKAVQIANRVKIVSGASLGKLSERTKSPTSKP